MAQAERPADLADRADVAAQVALVAGDLFGSDEEDEGEYGRAAGWEVGSSDNASAGPVAECPPSPDPDARS